MSVAIIEETKARTRVFTSELIISSVIKSSVYHCREKPVKLDLLVESLNEKTIKTIRIIKNKKKKHHLKQTEENKQRSWIQSSIMEKTKQ